MPTTYPEKGERELRTKIFREFGGVVNNSSRNALPEDAWSYLENIQPVGKANYQTVPPVTGHALPGSFLANVPYWFQYANVAGNDYIVLFMTNGLVFTFNTATNSYAQIGSGFSGSGSRMDQWKNEQLLVVDSTGYYSWNGAGVLTLISGTGVPTSGTDIAVAFGRVWIVQGRLITFSGADDFTATSFLVANGAGSLALTDPTIRNTVTRLKFQNGYLYIISATGMNVISDVYVPNGAVPPTPLFTNLNIQSIIGTDQPASVFAFNQALVFANQFGIYFLYGTNANKVSQDIDGTWLLIDFTQQLSGGQAVINNILCSCILLKRKADANLDAANVLAIEDPVSGKWWFAKLLPDLTFVTSAVKHNVPYLYGYDATQGSLYQLFDPTNSLVGAIPAVTIQSALWGMEDNLADKQIIRAGFEVNITNAGSGGTDFIMTIDSSDGTSTNAPLNAASGAAWINNALNTVQWINNALTVVSWFSNGYQLFNTTSPAGYGKYVGVTIASSGGVGFQFSAIDLDYKLGARWR